MVGDRLVEVVADEPEVGQVEANLLDESAFGGDAVEVAKKRHLEDDDGVDGRLASVAVEADSHPSDEREVDGREHAPQEVTLGHALLETELVEQLGDRVLATHHLDTASGLTGSHANYSTLACKPEGFGNSPCLLV